MLISELDEWLGSLPIDEPVNIDGETVYLKLDGDGAELGVEFLEGASEEQIRSALQRGFQMAMEFDAGWAMPPGGGTLLLTQWLPGVTDWTEAADALELLLNQVAALRAAETETVNRVEAVDGMSREERRIRSKLLGG